MLSALQRELKSLIGENRMGELFRKLTEEVLSNTSRLYNLAIGLQARFSALGEANVEGVVSFEDGNLQFNSVNKGLFYVIDHLTVDDLHANLKQRADQYLNIPEFHAYGVNRADQAAKFEEDRWLSDDPDCKVHFYYVSGDLRQETQNFIKRLGLELGGRRLDSSSLEEEFRGRDPLMVECKPEPRPRLELFRILLLKSLIEKFVGPVNNMRNLRDKTLVDLLPSPKLAGMTEDDFVCITVRLDHYNWNKDVVPAVLRDLFEKFCQSDLPPNAPRFYFFFGMEYPKDKPQVREEVVKAIADRTYGEALDELQPVSRADIAEWFTRHRPLLPKGLEAEETARQLFPDNGPYDMIDVEVRLQQLIDDHNRGLTLQTS